MTSADVAIIGGGQLARMMQQAAIGLGLRVRLLAEAPDVSAAQVVADHVVGDYRDLAVLRDAVADAPVVTFDHEHVPPEHLRALAAEGHACRPGPAALLYAQDKAEMRDRLGALGAPAPRSAVVSDASEVEAFAASVGGFPVVLKTTRGGYDGKGVWVVDGPSDTAQAFASGAVILAEEKVDFARELSALVVRSATGETRAYPVVESRQAAGVCKEVVAPAPGLAPALADAAQALALRVAAELEVTGILAVELFETRDGRILVNELAMRPHNTGHWTIDGAVTSQFENHLRAVLGLPLGSTDIRAPWAVMVNILGGTVADLGAASAAALAVDPGLKTHLYGKAVTPGRKVGHVTVCGDDLEKLLSVARDAVALYESGASAPVPEGEQHD